MEDRCGIGSHTDRCNCIEYKSRNTVKVDTVLLILPESFKPGVLLSVI